MNPEFEKLNRLRVNAGKNPLKVWKASQPALASAIASLEEDGYTDALPGANVKVEPVTDDPEIAEVLKDPEHPTEENPDEEHPEPTLVFFCHLGVAGGSLICP